MEFNCVFIVGAEEGLFPLTRASDDPDELEEERRLMYVAVTRAKQKLYVTYCDSRFMYGKTRPCRPSRFLGEMDDRLKKLYERPSLTAVGNGDYEHADSGKRISVGGHAAGNTAVVRNASAATGDYPAGTRVKHKKFGEGTVIGTTNVGKASYIVINFDKIGKITLSLAFAPIEKL